MRQKLLSGIVTFSNLEGNINILILNMSDYEYMNLRRAQRSDL
jgi:hypothetical protein